MRGGLPHAYFCYYISHVVRHISPVTYIAQKDTDTSDLFHMKRRPRAGALSSFAGQSSVGLWTLNISDNQANNRECDAVLPDNIFR